MLIFQQFGMCLKTYAPVPVWYPRTLDPPERRLYSRKRMRNVRDGCCLQQVEHLSRMIGGPTAQDGNLFLSFSVESFRGVRRSALRKYFPGVCLS
jgi:hypothetical protein